MYKIWKMIKLVLYQLYWLPMIKTWQKRKYMNPHAHIMFTMRTMGKNGKVPQDV